MDGIMKHRGIGESFFSINETFFHGVGPLQTLGSGFASGQGLVEWLKSMGGVLDERMVKVNHADEPLEALDIDQLGVSLDGLDLCWQR